ncbi:hypothetical protein GIB67_037457 [Kingdonia uniflora]|uniref:TF-B3 domain-containing protein n=1 Tax=Kingdonia uniflora TaxID=39325 RepID=A0A7J7NIY8_9MAGN|nr:hypothetical protein GIB67_037457 [Kingdonia uniflora]
MQQLPVKFLRYLDGEKCERDATLRRGGKTWCLTMKDSSFRDGWKDFARDHDLHIGDFVVFKHVGSLVFDVMVFDTTYCERKYPSRFDLENDDSSPRVTKNNEKQGGKMKVKKGVKVPYFKATLMRYNFSQNTMNIPLAFARSNNLINKRCTGTLRDNKNRSWKVNLSHKNCDETVYIGGGWRRFSAANNCREGDNRDELQCRGSLDKVLKWYQWIAVYLTLKKLFDNIGFEEFCSMKAGNSDNRLIRALVKRWWPSTHTFHFPYGELGFTPLDFAILTSISFGRGRELLFVNPSPFTTSQPP